MGDVENGRRIGFPEEFDHEAECTVGSHVDRVSGARYQPAFTYPEEQPRQQRQIKDDLRFAGRPADRPVRYEGDRIALAAACKQAVHTRQHQRHDHARRKDVTYISRLPPEQFRAEQVQQRHEEYPAEQAHRTELIPFQEGKDFYEDYAHKCMEDGQQHCDPGLDPQLGPIFYKPTGAEHSPQRKQQV